MLLETRVHFDVLKVDREISGEVNLTVCPKAGSCIYQIRYDQQQIEIGDTTKIAGKVGGGSSGKGLEVRACEFERSNGRRIPVALIYWRSGRLGTIELVLNDSQSRDNFDVVLSEHSLDSHATGIRPRTVGA